MLYWKESLLVSLIILIIRAGAQQDIEQLAKANNEVGLALLKSFPAGKNVFFSPASIYVALAMAYGAARTETADEMRNVLQYDKAGINVENVHQSFRSLLELLNNGSDEYKLSMANAILSSINYEVLPEYKELLKTHYAAVLKEVDFAGNNNQAVNEVNQWVNEKTNGKIPKFLDQLSKDTKMILLNAIYFKGTWNTAFNASDTKDESFYNGGVEPKSVPMMKLNDRFLYTSDEEKGFQALDLLYKGKDISMLILLPDKYDQLDQLEKSIDADQLHEIVQDLYSQKVDVSIPKFKLEDTRQLKESLQSLGMQKAFDGRADFSGISGNTDLYISEVVHKAVIEVNEEGSEAAAATGVIFLIKSSFFPERIPVFNANHPFLFFIRDRRSGMILFSGRINNL